LKIIVTGAGGQLGADVVRLAKDKGWQVYGYARNELDVTDLEAARRIVSGVKPDAVIHAAAYTKVDQAETEQDEAYRVNAAGTRNIALAAEEAGARLCYVSTDYVFDGTADQPYREYDQPHPLSVYGKSKLAGEEFVRSLSSKYFIVRTAWVYGEHGQNFVKTMLRLAREQDELRVVHDQIGSPTYTVDLAEFLLELVRTDYYGIYHATNTGSCSWYEFAQAIFAEAGIDVKVNPITTDQFPRPAKRPKYSVLDHMAIRAHGLTDLRHWREALRAYFHR
jgi:dTDP-4-dehydrorhamnose reductase